MSIAIKSPDFNFPLIFGDFRISIDDITSSVVDFSIDDVNSLGTNLVDFGNLNAIKYTSSDQNYYLSIFGRNEKPTYGVAAVQVSPYGYTEVSAGDYTHTESAYLMASTSTISEKTFVCILSKEVYDGTVRWYLYLPPKNARHIYYNVLNSFSEYTPFTPPEAGGGLGLADITSDPVDFPSLPLVSALGTGTVNMYRATQTSLREFSQYLWKGDFVDNVKKLFQDPMEAVVSVQIVPYTPTHSETPTNVHLSWIDTGVAMYPLTNQYVRIDCGTLEVSEFWASFLDYPPNTDVSIFLPYIGVKQLSVQDVMARKLHLIYNIDSLTGSCVAMLKCSGGGLDSVMYAWNGSCNMQIPIGARDFSSIYSSVVSLIAGAGAASMTKAATKALTAGMAAGATASIVGNLDLDTHTRQVGSISSVPGYMGNQIPYLIITRPKDSTPTNFNELNGRPSNLGGKIGDYSGYLEVTATHIEGFPATEKEKNVISSLLASGIII